MNPYDADVLIVGSGFGGSVCALRAAQAGLRTVVLERGRAMSPTVFEDMAAGRAPKLHTANSPGLVDIPRISGLSAVVSSAVGGGSQIYTAVTIPPPAEIFDDNWPTDLRAESLAPCFDRVAEMIRPSPIPKPLSRTLELERIGRRIGATVTRLPQAMDWPDDPSAMSQCPPEQDLWKNLTDWLQGGPVCRKRTLDRTYLAAAVAAGAEIRPLHEAREIIPSRDGYRVEYRCRNVDERHEGRLHARRVVLAAGAIGTVRLLFAGRDVYRCLPNVSGALGARFFTNGDMGAMLICDADHVPRDAGPPVTAWLDHWNTDRLYLMEIGHPPLPSMLLRAAALFGAGYVSRSQADTGWVYGVMGGDNVPGRLTHTGKGRLSYQRGNTFPSPYELGVQSRLADLAEVAGAKLVVPPNAFLSRFAVTVHPLGGAAMADKANRGVVNSFGEVFGHPGLFIADGSILPTSIGRAPSMTIAALAERVVSRLVESC